jgi:23S rRNA (adenine-N6)-dimethyltransferase
VEWAAGDGALTVPLSRLGRPLEAVEIDPRRAARLRRRVGTHVTVTVTVTEEDILRHTPPTVPHEVVANVPFHITTPVLRRLLALPAWRRAVLVLQWEVARKRAGVGGATQLTAQWWPWFDFRLVRRIPASAFAPAPSVDAGLLEVSRRSRALVMDRAGYQDWVRAVFTGRGRRLTGILATAGGVSPAAAEAWRRGQGLPARALPRDLTAVQWAQAYALSTTTGAGPPARSSRIAATSRPIRATSSSTESNRSVSRTRATNSSRTRRP